MRLIDGRPLAGECLERPKCDVELLAVDLRIIGEITGCDDCKENRADSATDKALDRLVGRERDQFCPTEGLAEYICHGVVDHHRAIRHEQPEVAFVDVETEEHGASDRRDCAQDIPGQLFELVSVLTLLQIEREAHEPNEEQATADHDVVLEEYCVEDGVAELEVNHAFRVLEEYTSHEEVRCQHEE